MNAGGDSPAWLGALTRPAAALATIALLGLAVFGQTIGHGLSNHDDTALITNNQHFLMDPGNWLGVFVTDPFEAMAFGAGGFYYRPVLFHSLMLDTAMRGPDPAMYHASNVAYHLIATSLLFLLLLRLEFSRAKSLFFALAFLVHPALAHATAWIPGRNDSLLGLFVLATVLGLHRFFERPSPLAFAATLLAWNATLYTKEGGLFVSALVPMLLAPHVLRDRALPRGTLALGAGWIASAVVWFALRRSTLGAFPLFGSQIPENLRMYVVYLGKTLLPLQLSVIPSDADTSVVPGLLVIALIVFLALRSTGRRLDVLALGLTWLLVGLAPALLAPELTRGLEHRLYVPSMGLAIFLAEARWPALPAPLERARIPAAGVLIAALAAATLVRLPDYQDPRHYWESAARTSPHAVEVPAGLCRLEVVERNYDAALPLCRRVGNARPHDPAFQILLGEIYMALEQPLKAADALQRATRLAPGTPQIWLRLADALAAEGRTREAAEARRKATEIRRRRAGGV